MQIIGGLIALLVGITLAVKTEWFMENFGRVAWFDKNLGTEGGSRLGYKLFGIILIFIGLVIMTGSGSIFFGWIFSPLTKYTNPV